MCALRTIAFLVVLAPTLALAQLTTDGNQVWRQGESLTNTPEIGDEFGFALAAGDFDGDGFEDAAIGVPGEDSHRGIVHVLRGGQSGLTNVAAQVWRQSTPGVPDADEPGDRFGATLATGDFDHDGFDDLAIAAPGENNAAGQVVVLYGTEDEGLSTVDVQLWSQVILELVGSDPNDRFGFAMAVGDFNHDTFDDLSIGAPGEQDDSGIVHVIYGSASGLLGPGNQRWRQDINGIVDVPEAGDVFGHSLAACDLNGDTFDDLVVGVPGEDGERGSIHVLFGSGIGITNADDRLWNEGEDGLPGEREEFDAFGFGVVCGDFDGDFFDDVAVSAIGEDEARGRVIVARGSINGLTSNGAALIEQPDVTPEGDREINERFGASIATGDFDWDGRADLAIGARGEDEDRGVAHVLYGSELGPDTATAQLFTQGFQGLLDEPLTGEFFGGVLATGNFAGDGATDLLIAATGDDDNDFQGIVHALIGNERPQLNAVVGAGLGRPALETVSHKALATLFGVGFTTGPGRDAGSGDLVDGRLPTILDGVCLELDGKPAPLLGLYPEQINFQVDAPNKDSVTLRLLRNCSSGAPPVHPVVSNELDVSLAPVSPDFFTSSIRSKGQKWPAAINTTTGRRVGLPLLGPEFEPAAAGDIVALFVTGLGETSPPFDPGALPPNNAEGAAPTVFAVTVTIDGVDATVLYAGTAPGFAGLYQVNIVIPETPNSGNVRINMTSAGGGPVATTPDNGFIAVQ